ncbi:MAG: oligoendopeptidase F family protein [Deltaproteobacteria bacterium]|nr:oligoendopeptidase F family protein [Deltaproteobacteria bacterium]
MRIALLLSLLVGPAYATDEDPEATEAAVAETEEVAVQDTWDLSHVFPTLEEWEAATARADADIEALSECEGQLADPAMLRSCLERIDTYAGNLSNADIRDAEWRARAQRGGLLWAAFGEAVSWFEPEILALGKKKVDKALAKEPGLAPFAYYLHTTLRHGEHTLPPEQEALLAASATLRRGPGQIYRVLLNAELPWPTITLDDGTEVTLDTAAYAHHRASPSREERKRVYDAYYGALADYQGTAGAAVGVSTQGHWFIANARGYDTCLEAALDAEFLPQEVYRTLIERTNANLPTLHRYLKLRARMLGIDDLAYYDLYPPLVQIDEEFPIARGKELTITSAAPLGKEYTDLLEKGFAERWMDVYPQPGKSPGAYMDGGSYDVHPYVLMNYTGDYESVSTLAHEWGHAAHSAFTNTTQPHATADYATFIAEVASTLAEALLQEHMLEQTESDAERLLYLGADLESLRVTFFRQAMFSEFELALHEMAEQGEPITGEGLSERYLELVRRYHGHDQGITTIDEAYAVEWVFVQHFFYNFYVWQYSTSIAASSLLAKDVLGGEDGAVERYLDLLRAGGSDDPYLLLKRAGVDMASPEPYDALAARMDAIMDDMEAILDRMEEEKEEAPPSEETAPTEETPE